MKKQLILIAILFLGLFIQLAAQKTTTNKIPSDTSLVSSKEELKKLTDASQGNYKYKGEDCFMTTKSLSFSSPPEGGFSAYKDRNNQEKGEIKIKEIETDKVMTALEEKIQVIVAFRWAYEDRLLYLMDILETKITICMP